MRSSMAELELRNCIASVELRLDALSLDSPELLLLVALRELDVLFLNSWIRPSKDFLGQSDIQTFGFYGISRLLSRCDYSGGIPLFPATAEMREHAVLYLMHSAELACLKGALELTERRLIELELIGPKHFKLLSGARSGVERRQRDLMIELYKVLRPQPENPLRNRWGDNLDSEMCDRLSENTYIWREHFIGYGATAFLDEAFFFKAIPLVTSNLLSEFFSHDTQFGNLTFAHVTGALTYAISFAQKHYLASILLAQKNQELSVSNLVCPISLAEDLIDVFEFEMGLDRADARILFSLLVLDASDHEYDFLQGRHLPPFIKTSRDQIIRPGFTLLTDPLPFVIRKLNKTFPRDWDIAMNKVEEGFRRDLYKLFSDSQFYCVPSQVQLRTNGKTITDIDGIVFDRISGTIGFYQLKWQLPFWGSLRERESRRSNLHETASAWFSRVTEWLNDQDQASLRATFRFKKDEPPIKNIIGFVVGRYFSDFSELDPEGIDGISWASWPEFIFARHSAKETGDLQADIAEYLRSLSSIDMDNPTEPEVIGDFTFEYAFET